MSQAGNSTVNRPALHPGVRGSDLVVGLAAPCAAALALQAIPQAEKPSYLPWLFLLAVISGSWWGGLRAGLPAAVLGGVLYLGYPAFEGRTVPLLFVNSGIVQGLLLGLCGCLIAWLGEQLHRERMQAAEVAKQALQHQRELECEVGERKRAEAALRAGEESLRMALEASRTVAWSWDLRSGRIEHSQTSRLVLGGTPETVEQFVALIHPDDRQRVEDALIRVLDGRGAYDEEFRIVRSDGEVRWVADEGNLVYDVNGKPERLVGCLRDVTEQHRILEALGEADRRKDEFLAMLAHELRNPLAPIRTAVRLLQLQQIEPGPSRRHLELIERQVGNMARLLEDLLEVSRITRGTVKLQLGRVELRQVLREALEVCQPLLRQRQHRLEVSLPETPVHLVADRLRIEQVIVNLVNNAAKYTDAGGQVSVEVEVRERFTLSRGAPPAEDFPDTGTRPVAGTPAPPGKECERGCVEIRVRDTGRGIAPELLPRVFDLFVQGEHGLDRSQGGLGIGLTMVRRLVEMHGGAVTVESAGVGRGSVFTVSLPLEDTGNPGPGEGTSTPRSGTATAGAPPLSGVSPLGSMDAPASVGPRVTPPFARRILVVDDSRDGAEALLELVEMWGYEGRAVFDGPAALQAVEAFQPSVVICDMGMPGMDGYAVGRCLRGDTAASRSLLAGAPAGAPGSRRFPILIAVTGYGREEDRRRSAEAGFAYHLTKPIEPEELLRLLAALTAGEGIGVS